MKSVGLFFRGAWVGGVLWAAFAAAETPVPREPLRGVTGLPLEQRRAFLRGTLTDWRNDTDERKGLAAPPIQKLFPADAKRLELIRPDQFSVGTMSVREAIRDRRSRRDYSGASFTREELSYLLWATQGISKLDHDEQGTLVAQYRTVPSGGARHPFETYLMINRVAGVPPGLYRYLPVSHQLLVIKEDGSLGRRVAEACYGQTFTGNSAVTFIWTAIPSRTEWHYGGIAAKLIAIDVGHVGQNLYLAAESIHGGVCAVMGYHQARMDDLLGLDGKEEFVVYLAAAGKLNETTHP